MAIDIVKIKSANEIKNGTLVVTCGVTGFPTSPGTILYNQNVLNTPSISSIESKFDNRFDDPSYYYGVGNNGVIGV